MKKRAVITGIGVISSIGTGKEQFLRGLKACVSGVKSVPYFDISNYRTHQGAIITGFNKDRYVMADGTSKRNLVMFWACGPPRKRYLMQSSRWIRWTKKE